MVMKILILGAGQVGGSLAEHLVDDHNDITIIDNDAKRLRQLQRQLDIRTVHGQASHPDVLERAGAEASDMMIAVTNSDETNMIGCQIAHTLFQIPTKIARIRASNYVGYDSLFANKAIPIDVIISPEQLVTRFVQRLIEFPGALQVLDFAEGKVRLVAVKPIYGGPMVGKSIHDLYQSMPDVEMRVAAIFRRNHSVPIVDKTIIEVGDEVFFLATPMHIRKTLEALGRLANPYKNIMIAGGGNIGQRLAQALEHKFRVKIIDHNSQRSQNLAEVLHKTTVLLGDASDREMLVNEDIEAVDVFCAVTNDDEVNIMSCLQAKRLGVRQVMALIGRTAYVDLVEGGLIDIAVSPQQVTIGSILMHMRHGDMVNVYSLRHGAAEAIELVVHGDEKTSSVVGRRVDQIKLTTDVVIGAVVRGEQTLMATPDLELAAEDHVIIFLMNKRSLAEVERLFQVNVGFFS